MKKNKYKYETVEEMIKNIDDKWKKFLSNYILLNVIGTNNFSEFKTIEQLDKVLDFLEDREFEYSEWCEKNHFEAEKYKEYYNFCYYCMEYIYSLCDETYECVGEIDNAKN